MAQGTDDSSLVVIRITVWIRSCLKFFFYHFTQEVLAIVEVCTLRVLLLDAVLLKYVLEMVFLVLSIVCFNCIPENQGDYGSCMVIVHIHRDFLMCSTYKPHFFKDFF